MAHGVPARRDGRRSQYGSTTRTREGGRTSRDRSAGLAAGSGREKARPPGPGERASHSVACTNQVLWLAEKIQLVLRLIPQASPGFARRCRARPNNATPLVKCTRLPDPLCSRDRVTFLELGPHAQLLEVRRVRKHPVPQFPARLGKDAEALQKLNGFPAGGFVVSNSRTTPGTVTTAGREGPQHGRGGAWPEGARAGKSAGFSVDVSASFRRRLEEGLQLAEESIAGDDVRRVAGGHLD